MCDEKITLDQDISRFYVALVDGQACLYAFVRTERVDSRGRGTYTAYMDAAWDMLAFASHTYLITRWIGTGRCDPQKGIPTSWGAQPYVWIRSDASWF